MIGQNGGSEGVRGVPVTLDELRVQDAERAEARSSGKQKRAGAFVTRPHRSGKRRFGRRK